MIDRVIIYQRLEVITYHIIAEKRERADMYVYVYIRTRSHRTRDDDRIRAVRDAGSANSVVHRVNALPIRMDHGQTMTLEGFGGSIAI